MNGELLQAGAQVVGDQLQGEALLRQHASTLQAGEAGAGAEGAAPQVPR